MVVSIKDVNIAREQGFKIFFPKKDTDNKTTTVINIEIEGVVGCGSTDISVFQLLIDLQGFPDIINRPIVIDPPDDEIFHMNILRPTYHAITGQKKLPSLCILTLTKNWDELPSQARTLTSLLWGISGSLMNEDEVSRAELHDPRC